MTTDLRERGDISLHDLTQLGEATTEVLVTLEQADSIYTQLQQQVWFDPEREDGAFSPRNPLWRGLVIHPTAER